MSATIQEIPTRGLQIATFKGWIGNGDTISGDTTGLKEVKSYQTQDGVASNNFDGQYEKGKLYTVQNNAKNGGDGSNWFVTDQEKFNQKDGNITYWKVDEKNNWQQVAEGTTGAQPWKFSSDKNWYGLNVPSGSTTTVSRDNGSQGYDFKAAEPQFYQGTRIPVYKGNLPSLPPRIIAQAQTPVTSSRTTTPAVVKPQPCRGGDCPTIITPTPN